MKRLLLVMMLAACGADHAWTQEGWTAKWIAAPWSTVRDGAEADGSKPMPIFRREFEIRGKIEKAELRIAGLGQYEARLDGTLVADLGLHQAWTDYRKTITYDTYDETSQLSAGRHALTVMVGNGMYNVQKTKGRYTKFEGSFGSPKIIAELRLQFMDGSSEVVGTDTQWRVARSPVVFSSTYGGEDFDARREDVGWERAGFNDQEWTPAETVDGPGGRLQAAIAPDVRVVTRNTHAVSTTTLSAGRVVYDFGLNMAGRPSLIVTGPPGASLGLTPGELLNADGTVSQKSSGGPMWWTYTLRGDKQEWWRPQFGYYGFRYLQAEWICAEGPCAEGSINSITVDRLSSASPATGTFESSNETLNSIHALIVNAMHNNEASLFTDCPHREKLGWLEETHLVASGLMFNNDLQGLYAATEKNIADAQHDDGGVPTIAPQYTKFGTDPKYAVFDDSPEWGSASVLAPWAAYRFYGDAGDLDHSYSTMKAYVAFLEGKAQEGIVAYGLGDWYDIGPGDPGFEKNTTLGVTGTLMLYEDARAMQKIAALLGKSSEAKEYAALANREKTAFNHHFWDAKAGYYDKGSQTANAMPLALGIVPEGKRAAVLKHIVGDIHAHNDHVTTGEIGYPYLLRALMEGNRNDVVLAMLLRKDPPSYGSQLAAGATSLTEAWDANPKNSQDHFMLGDAEEWFYRGLGGIDYDMSRPDAIVIRPAILDGIDWVRCEYLSHLGKIESDWKRNGLITTMDVTIPSAATAIIYIPTTVGATVMEGNDPANKAEGVMFLRIENNAAVYRVVSGSYRFTITEKAN